MPQMYIRIHVKYPLLLSNFNEAWTFSADFRKILNCQISWKFYQWEPSCSMRIDGHEFSERAQNDTTSLAWRVLPIFEEDTWREYKIAHSVLKTTRTDTFVKFYQAIVLPVLPYETETWTTTQQLRRIDTLQKFRVCRPIAGGTVYYH